jgi:translation initiation factor IF-3
MRLVGDKGEQLGVMALYQALEMAKKKGFDLVEVAPRQFSVCRLMDYGKLNTNKPKKNAKCGKARRPQS